eukprot:CAMPEP_0172521048 /NCGR_PEP_ID=MMETSP1066-20121228/292353_1 /TAXON_ID=671091 /ORGANISM="Coscinodiscus wailesii, Strain CCMP2513" /LENGTH=528 /DNA_ID=CAMNT_0013303897 /DNA_START=255 /DNA_END=1841 /DNA_ORIENTATION=-
MPFLTRQSYSRLYSFSLRSNNLGASRILFQTAISSDDLVTSNNDKEEAAARVKIPKKFVPFPFQYHEELTLRVDSLTNLGIGICRTPSDFAPVPNWVVMTPNVIPGELVRVRIFRNHKTYSDADLLEVSEPSPDRINTPRCPLSTVCGGCQYQHMTLSSQREWKREQVSELLTRIGGFAPPRRLPRVNPTVGTDRAFHYRSKITPHYDAPRDRPSIGPIGFKEKRTRRLVDVPYCPIATEGLNAKLAEVREDVARQVREGTIRRPKKGATLLLREANEGVVTDHNTYVTADVGGLTFRFLAGNFFQNNPHVLPIMVEHVVRAARGGDGEGGGATSTMTHLIDCYCGVRAARGGDGEGGGATSTMTHLIDCYCGSGLFGISCAARFEKVVGIEVNERAVEEASANAALNGITNCEFVAASAEAIFRNDVVNLFPRSRTAVVIDPPRKGCSEEFLEQLCEYGPERVVYMSCDPATQARDAKVLAEKGGYSIGSVQPFDLFPQTRHIECLIVFDRCEEEESGGHTAESDEQ